MISSNNKIKYLTNKDLLAEIHNSKKTYSEFTSKEYEDYDLITSDLKTITAEQLETARKKKVADYISKTKKEMVAKGYKNPTIEYSVDNIPEDSIVIRLMTFEHIPINEDKIGKAKTIADKHIRCNFPPYQHYIFRNDEFICVGKSHWRGGLENGEFCLTHGRMTSKLAIMFMTLVERYGHKGNWRGYSYLEEMKAQAILQLSQVGLQFDESRSQNGFAYYTSIVSNSFTRILNIEKKNQNIRDDLLTMHGVSSSYTRAVDNEMAQRKLADSLLEEKKNKR